MTAPIARFLIDFDAHANDDVQPTEEIQPLTLVQPPPPPAEDPAELLRAAEERGRQAGRAEAQAAFDAVLATERAGFEQRLVAERQHWTEAEADRLIAQMSESLQTIEATVIASIARILVPFLTASVREQILDDLSETLSGLLSDGQHPLVRISGAEDLVRAVQARLGARAAPLQVQVDASPEVRVVAGDTIIETQLQAWVGRLTAAVA